MTFLPIVTRELRVAARRPATYWVRSIAGLVMVVAGVSLYLMVQAEPPKQTAMYLFIALTAIAAIYALFSGIRSTSDCISQEKRDGTLGLLFLTDLRGYDVVLGKLVANSLNAFYAVLAVLPMLAIPLLMGSVTPGEYGRMALVTLNALFFSLAIGICVSSFSRSAQRAAWFTAALITALTFLPPLYALVSSLSSGPPFSRLILLPSAAFAYYQSLDVIYRTGGAPFWYSLATVHVLAWAALGLASAIAPRTWQERPAGRQRLRWRERWRAWSFGNSAERAQFRRVLLEENPFLWLSARSRGKPIAVWVFLGLVGCFWVWGLAKYRRDWLNEGMYFGTTLFLNFVLRCWFASEATRQLAEDRKAGALELLLCTPLSVRDILRGQQLALMRQFLGPVVATLALEAVFMRATVLDTEGPSSSFWYVLYAGLILMLVADLVAIFWVGMWQGLSARTHTLALNATVGRILVWPWAGFLLALIFVSLLSIQNINPPEPTWLFFLGAWFISGIGADLAFGAAARSKLLHEFRFTAQQTFSPKAPWWRRLAGAPAPGRSQGA